MRYLKSLVVFVLVPILMSGCANMRFSSLDICVAGGTAGAATVGAGIGSGLTGGLIGAGVGIVVASVLCSGEGGESVMTAESDVPVTTAELDVPVTTAELDVPVTIVDSDGDGIPDDRDRCPGIPRGEGGDDHGCPAVAAGKETIVIVTNIGFEFDSSRVPDNFKTALDSVIDILEARPEIGIQIIGHADDAGSDEYNLSLSLRRAVSVREYLIGRGIPVTRMSVSGRGERMPLVSNRTEGGRAVNRRVEFKVR